MIEPETWNDSVTERHQFLLADHDARKQRDDAIILRSGGPVRLISVALAALLTTTSVLAQTPTGTILGSVWDAQGAVVPGATVTATNVGTRYSREAVTDDAGDYALRLLPIGNYMVVVSITGFKSFTQTGIVLEVGRNARVDATLELGAVEESLTVVADAPLVETASASLSRTVG